MSFSNDVKQEIIANRPLRMRCKQAQAYGLLLFARRFCRDEVSIRTESPEIRELYVWFLRDILGKQAELACKEQALRGKMLYTARLTHRDDRDRLMEYFSQGEEDAVNTGLVGDPERLSAFLGGAFLACGSLTHPAKGYHLELVAGSPGLCLELAGLLEEAVPGARRSTRRGKHFVYYKECGQIEDFLATIGASKASLAMIEVEIIKGVRNKANRVTNCETANIDKLVKASSGQIEDIRYILDTKGEDFLPGNLREVALLRLENPELSLRQLSEEMNGSISRSGLHHRLDKLSKIAENIRLERGERGDGHD